MLPASSTFNPRLLMAEFNPAARTADGPISTPRRSWPRSRGTPRILIFCTRPPITKAPAKNELRRQPVQHACKRNGFADVFKAANPRHHALDPHAKARVRNGAVAPQIQIPTEGFARQFMLIDAAQ